MVRVSRNTGSYAEINGLKMYYEIRGRGKPLVLLHGGAGSTGIFDEVLTPMLSKSRMVVTADLQAHGRTRDIDRPFRYETMADDIAELIKKLKLGKVDIIGYSLGAGVALRTAVQHTKLIRKLVVVSAPYTSKGWYPEVLEAMAKSGPESAQRMKKTPMYRTYIRVAPKPDDWPLIFTKLGELLRRDYDWSKEVMELEVPTMIAIGDADSVRTSHAIEFFQLLGGGKEDADWDGSKMSKARLLVLPGTTHYNSFSSPLLAQGVMRFLDEHPGPKNGSLP